MRNTIYLAMAMLLAFTAKSASAHCEVPCGIYDDERRFVSMIEDHSTIEKAIAQIDELAGKHDAQDLNQLVRWVTTKEDHATRIQQTIAQYFMTQRLKADGENYTKKLTTAHAVMVAAMKCKQTAAPDSAVALKKAIHDFYRAYEGKEPHLHP
ncbi:superoxide dismutase [Ni] [Rosistilla oblonga]|uniref:Nickel-containing superoxide dismutase n=1 Tax=Rosistilla oblonga TaxID=2527990 RepID=A0A518IMV7_9BACT|nr:superoxide dismutase [Ni] [Rosistilla oblonga]QDV54416.1 Nickel-containing superoxide dismutase [Rosistilla oblonga]